MNFVAFGCSEVIMQKNTAFRENHTVLRPKMIERWICKTTSGQVVGKFNFCSSWTEVKKDFAATFGEVPCSGFVPSWDKVRYKSVRSLRFLLPAL